MKLSSKGKQLVEYALTNRAWTLEDLEKHSTFSIATVKKFSAGGNVRRTTFVNLCKVLKIDWEIASAQTVAPKSSRDRTTTASEPDETTLFETLRDRSSTPLQFDEKQIRERCRQKILSQHSRMRLLNGEEIGVDQLYVDVYLLEKPEHKHFNSPNRLLKSFDIDKDRLALSKRIQRNPGFDVANENSKLVILGKPGSGKTTFLKHLAVDWCHGKFQTQLITIIIELRRIRDKDWIFLSVVDKEIGLDNWSLFFDLSTQVKSHKATVTSLEASLRIIQSTAPKKENNKELLERQLNSERKKIIESERKLNNLPLQVLLRQGKLLVLMDGLDEISNQGIRA